MNTILFYGGIILAGCALIGGIALFAVYKIRAVKLEAELNEEFGKRIK